MNFQKHCHLGAGITKLKWITKIKVLYLKTTVIIINLKNILLKRKS